jgi:hypothetical protein
LENEMAAQFANSSNQIAALKELYTDDKEYMKDLVYKENPFLALVPKNESPEGFAGKYIPVPLEYGTPQGRSHTFSNAQNQQTATQLASFFVYVIEDYQLVTITNLLMEQTKTNAGAFVDAAKLQMDGGFRNITNNIAFELFADGSGERGRIASATGPSTINGLADSYVITLTNAQQIVNFEVGMLLVNFLNTAGTISAVSANFGFVNAVDRANGIITIQSLNSSGTPTADASWTTANQSLGISGDVISGATGVGGTSGSYVALSGLAAWIPVSSPASNDSFWGVNRSADPTRLAGCRFDARSFTIEEGMTSALAFLNREGGKPDLAVMDFASYASLVNALGAKVQYVQVNHDEVEVAFEGITFQSAYGRVTVLADRSCPPQTCYLLTMNTWKLRSLGKVPHILTYGMEGLEGLRVGNADALEIRIGYYGNLICSAPGWNCVVRLSS